jgi:hypothetical protein
MEEYTTEKLISKISRSEGLAIAVICVGVVLLIFEEWTSVQSFRDSFKVLDSFIPLVLGIVLLESNRRRIKKLRGSYIRFDGELIEFKSRGVEKKYSSHEELESVEIKLDRILLTDLKGEQGIIYLDDYVGDGEQKQIKKAFGLRLKP